MKSDDIIKNINLYHGGENEKVDFNMTYWTSDIKYAEDHSKKHKLGKLYSTIISNSRIKRINSGDMIFYWFYKKYDIDELRTKYDILFSKSNNEITVFILNDKNIKISKL